MLISPVKLFICHAAPTLLADGQFFSLKENVKLDVFAFTLVFPRVPAMFQLREPPVMFPSHLFCENRF
jgi:hypothetical protein